MNSKRVVPVVLWPACLAILAGVVASAPAQQPTPAKQNELVAAKLIYVAPIADDLDPWIADSLHHWGRYKVTSNPEGVDLVIQATNPDKDLKLETLGGTAEPRGAARPPYPFPKKKHDDLPASSISVIDWATGQTVWRADILDRKPKKDEADLPAGPQTKIFARGMTADQLAQKVVDKLKEYERELEQSAGGKK
jgi:hypothetical protein